MRQITHVICFGVFDLPRAMRTYVDFTHSTLDRNSNPRLFSAGLLRNADDIRGSIDDRMVPVEFLGVVSRHSIERRGDID